MNIYKLNYLDTENAIVDLIAKGVYNEELEYTNGTQAVVYIGKILKADETYYDGVFYDVMTTDIIDFTPNEVFPIDCVHSFAGYAQNADGPIEIIE
jgi:hypothetical protein